MINLTGKFRIFGLSAMAITWLSAAPLALAQNADTAPAPKLPNGANSISETFDDWVLNCQATAKGTECGLLQVLSQQNGQRILSLSVNPKEASGTHLGSLVLPFGLELAKGVTLQLDEQTVSQPLAFKTCVPTGCIVPLSWTAQQYAGLQGAAQMKLVAQSVSNEPFAISVSLKGFSAAGKRALAIIE